MGPVYMKDFLLLPVIETDQIQRNDWMDGRAEGSRTRGSWITRVGIFISLCCVFIESTCKRQFGYRVAAEL